MTAAGSGRRRNETTRIRILAVTADLLEERGYEQLTLVDIAERAQVGRQTLYRWWSSKAVIVCDCVLEDATLFEPVAMAASLDAIGAIRDWLTESYTRLTEPRQAALFRAFLAAAASDGDAQARLQDRFMAPLAESITATFVTGIERGQIRSSASGKSMAQLLLGAMVYSLVAGVELGPSWVDEVMSTINVEVGPSPIG